jgi:hypothetical protein
MTWKSLAKRTNSLPEGWSTPDEIAADLDCEINEVPKILAAAIRDKLVERQNFPCWTPGSRQLLYQTGYRQLTPGTNPTPAPAKPPHGTSDLEEHVRRIAARHPDMPNHRIVAYLPPRHRQSVNAAQIAAILGR